MSQKIKEFTEKSLKAREIFRSHKVNHNNVEELALESARHLGEGYLHQAVIFDYKTNLLNINTISKSFCDKPGFDLKSGHPDWFANEFLGLMNADKGYVRSLKQILDDNSDIQAETIFEKGANQDFRAGLNSFSYNGAQAFMSVTYKFTLRGERK